MKKTQYFLAFLFALLMSTAAVAQQFEGKISIKSEILDLPPDQASMKSMMESTIHTYIKGDRSRTETSSPMIGKMFVISDKSKKEVITCMDMMGSKKAIVSGMDDYAQNAAQQGFSKPEFRETQESKIIAGYNCKKSICTMKSPETGELTMDIWYTKEIPNMNNEYAELSGMPLEYTIDMMGMKLHFFTTEVSKESVDESYFTVPADYERMTQQEFQKSMGGGK